MPTLRAGLAYAAGGFLGGIVFWHSVGFWSLVSEAVLRPTPGAGIADNGRPVPLIHRRAVTKAPSKVPAPADSFAGSAGTGPEPATLAAAAPAALAPQETAALRSGSACSAEPAAEGASRIAAFACAAAAQGPSRGLLPPAPPRRAAVAGWATRIEMPAEPDAVATTDH